MEQFNTFINELPDYAGIFLLMLSTFLIGYFSAWGLLRNKYQEMLKKIGRKSSVPKEADKTNDIDVIFTEIEPKIIEVVKKTQEQFELQKEEEEEEPETIDEDETPEEVEEAIESKPGSEIAENARTSYITYTHNKPRLDFDSFGFADKENAQDLTKINGIGPYIEQKLNEIGIYNYEQISRLRDNDIRVLTELIDFFPGRIERDDWVGQAGDLVN